MRHKLEDGEVLVLKKACNHFKGIEAVGGKIYITNHRVVFISHKVNFQNHQLSIKYDEIDEVSFYNTFGFFPNGLRIITAYGENEKFVVWGRKKVKQLIDAQRVA